MESDAGVTQYTSTTTMSWKPNPKYKFTFGLWTVGNVGRDPFGLPTRPELSAAQICDLVGEGGAYGVNFHDNDLLPIDANAAEVAEIKRDFSAALERNNLKVPMATVNLFTEAVFKDGAFTSHDPEVRAYAVQKTFRAMDLGAEFGAKIFVLWGGREGAESDAHKDPYQAIQHTRQAFNLLAAYNIEKGYGYKFALEAKPNEPRGHIYNAVTGSYLAFITTLEHPEMFGVNPEVAHEHMAGLNFVHQVAAALDAKKLFHIDLNDQEFGRYDQDFRFGSANLKHCFHLVKLLEDYKYDAPRSFDCHAYRASDYEDLKWFISGNMRTYELLADKANQWNTDKDIQALVSKIVAGDEKVTKLLQSSAGSSVSAISEAAFDRHALATKRLPYEQLDQLTMELLMGAR